MSTADHQRASAIETNPQPFNVVLLLELGQDGSADDIEALALKVLDVVEQHAPHIAEGAVVSGQFDPAAVELDLTVVADDLAALHERVAELLTILQHEAHLGILSGETRTSSSPRRELAVA